MGAGSSTPRPGDTSEDSPSDCRFYFINADFIRKFEGVVLPFHQQIKEQHPEEIVEVTLSYVAAVLGVHIKECLAVSHRWMDQNQPDPDGEQLKALKGFLASPAGASIKCIATGPQTLAFPVRR